MKSIACPSCAAPMERREFSRKPHGGVDLDLCFACHAIWFDQFESAQLTPGAMLDLFGQIHEHHDQPPRPLGDALRCPACRERARRDPAKIVDGMLAGRRFEEPPARRGSRAAAPAGWAVAPEGLVDLVGEALDFLMSD